MSSILKTIRSRAISLSSSSVNWQQVWLIIEKKKHMSPISIYYSVVYVKRTCTARIQINMFLVGLVCMKESGERGKMCFCETDYCNGQQSQHQQYNIGFFLTILTFIYMMTNRIIRFPLTSLHPSHYRIIAGNNVLATHWYLEILFIWDTLISIPIY